MADRELLIGCLLVDRFGILCPVNVHISRAIDIAWAA
jgi:hypothetical protein